MDVRPSPLKIGSSVAILGLDWLVFAGTLGSVENWLPGTVLGAVAAAACVAVIERRSRSLLPTTLRSLFAGAVVAAPLPVLGSLVAAVSFVWSLVARPRAEGASGAG